VIKVLCEVHTGLDVRVKDFSLLATRVARDNGARPRNKFVRHLASSKMATSHTAGKPE
jgi:hypothetical protein